MVLKFKKYRTSMRKPSADADLLKSLKSRCLPQPRFPSHEKTDNPNRLAGHIPQKAYPLRDVCVQNEENPSMGFPRSIPETKMRSHVWPWGIKIGQIQSFFFKLSREQAIFLPLGGNNLPEGLHVYIRIQSARPF